MKRLIPVGVFALVFTLFLASTPEAQVHIVRGFRAAITFVVNGIGTTTTAAVTLQNQTAAADGAQQYSPGLSLIGQGWKTDATAGSQPVETRFELRPVQGTANPTFSLVLMGRVNEGSWTDIGTWDSIQRFRALYVQADTAGAIRIDGRVTINSATGGTETHSNWAESVGIRFQYAGVPSITTAGITGDGFGGGASILTGSTDTFGFIRVGAATEGIIAFATDWGTNLQQGCTANNEDGTPTYVQVTDKTMRLAGGTRAVPVAWTSSSVVNWICGGSR